MGRCYLPWARFSPCAVEWLEGHWITSIRFAALPRQNALCFDCNLVDVQFKECWALDSHTHKMCPRTGRIAHQNLRSLESWHIIPKPASPMAACRMTLSTSCNSHFQSLWHLCLVVIVLDLIDVLSRQGIVPFNSIRNNGSTLKEPSDGQHGETSFMSGHSTTGFLSAPPPIIAQWVEQSIGNSPWLWMTTCSKIHSTAFYNILHTHTCIYIYMHCIYIYITKTGTAPWSLSLIILTPFYHPLSTQCAFWRTHLAILHACTHVE